MKSLLDYDILVNDVFYKSWHILEWIEKNPDMSALDREAVSNTIMDALVYKGLINKDEESLDLDNLCIRKSLDYHKYQEHPFVTGIPLWMMEKYEKIINMATGSITASVFLSKPASKLVSFCIYDMNNVASFIFDDFTFMTCDYDSPTRLGQRATERPFIEVTIKEEKYLLDWLTKRMFKSDKFKEKYNMQITYKKAKKDFTPDDRKHYYELSKEIKDANQIASSLLCLLPIFQFEHMQGGNCAEQYYYMKKMENAYKMALDEESSLMKIFKKGDNFGANLHNWHK